MTTVKQSARPIMALPTARLFVGVTLLVLALLMVLSFFSMSWLEEKKDASHSEDKLTPFEIWQGKNDGDEVTLNFGKDMPNGGFDDVRFLDRLLIFMPLLGMAIGTLALLYVLLLRSPRALLITIAALSFLFMIYPYLWEMWNVADMRGGLKEMGLRGDTLDQGIDAFKETYSMGEFAMLGLLAFLVSLLGLAAEAELPPTLKQG